MVVKSRAGVLYFYGTFDEHFVSFEIKHQATCVRYKQVKVVFFYEPKIRLTWYHSWLKSNRLSGFELFTVVYRLKRRFSHWKRLLVITRTCFITNSRLFLTAKNEESAKSLIQKWVEMFYEYNLSVPAIERSFRLTYELCPRNMWLLEIWCLSDSNHIRIHVGN